MDQIKFENPDILYALALVPVLALVFWFIGQRRKKALQRLGDRGLVRQLMPEYSWRRPILKNGLVLLAIASLIVGLANPQTGSKLETVKREGAEIIIAIDVSNSMKAEDIRPNRLERAKRSIQQLLRKLRNDKIGIIVFAGQAYVQLPVTSDYSAARMFLETIDTDIVPVQGTAIGSAVNLALESFSDTETRNKALIVITDGENHEDDAVQAAQQAAEAGVVVHTIGMGNPKGTPIPVYSASGQKDFRKDGQGNIIMTKLNEGTLQQVSAAGNGLYVRASNASTGLEALYERINEMDKQEFEARVFADYEDQYQVFLALAALLLLLEALVLPRKNRILSKIDIFKVKV